MWGRKGLIVAGFFGLLLVGAVTLAFWAYGRDPLLSLPPPEHGLKAERHDVFRVQLELLLPLGFRPAVSVG